MSETSDIQQKTNDSDEAIIAKQEIQRFINGKKELYNNLISFLENSEDDENDFQNVNKFIDIQHLFKYRNIQHI